MIQTFRSVIVVGICVGLLATTSMDRRAMGATASNPFDGAWIATVSCPNYAGALGYSFDVPSKVVNGSLHGERMKEGEPGHLVLDGQISGDGHAQLYAKGLIGAAQFAVGQRPKGTDYGYHVLAQFEADKGSGHRVEGRPCDLTFVRQ